MRFKELLVELDLNPATAFSKGFDRGSDTVDRIMSPSKWGSDSRSSTSAAKKSEGRIQLGLDRFELRDAQEIMSAVIKGDVDNLSRQQIETARKLLARLNDL